MIHRRLPTLPAVGEGIERNEYHKSICNHRWRNWGSDSDHFSCFPKGGHCPTRGAFSYGDPVLVIKCTVQSAILKLHASKLTGKELCKVNLGSFKPSPSC